MSQNMNMIFYPIDPVQVAIFIGEKMVDKSKHPLLLILEDIWFSVFGGIDDVVNQLCVRTHKNQVLVEK